MNRSEAIVAASAAANAVYRMLGAGAGGWFHELGDAAIEELAAFVERYPQAPPEALYREGSGRHYERRPYGSDVALAAAVDTFHAALPKLLSRVQRDTTIPATARKPRVARPKRTLAPKGKRKCDPT